MSRVLLLIPHASYRTAAFMDAARELGVEVTVGTDVEQPLQALEPDRMVALDYADPRHGADQVEAFAGDHPFDTLLAVDDAGVTLAAHAARRLELPYSPVAAVEATRNKHLLREALSAAGLPSPPHRLCAVTHDPRAVASDLTFPVVVKPLPLSASVGVIRANDVDEFAAAFERARAILATPKHQAECGEDAAYILVEGYVPGIEVAVEGLLTDGRLRTLAIFDKPDALEGPYFEETIYVTPSRLPEERQREVHEAAQAAASAVGLRDGAVHVELRLNEDGAFPIDVAARSIGGLCARALAFAGGVSLEELLLRHATGAGDDAIDREARASGVIMVPIPAAGTLRAVSGVEEAEAVPLIESVEMTIAVGSPVVPLPEGGDYLGFIFARGDTPEDVEAALREAHARLVFTIS
jgi:biotin carboxylase